MERDKLLNRKVILPVALILVALLLAFLLIPKPKLLSGLSFSEAHYHAGHLVQLDLTKDHKYRLYTPLNQISPLLIRLTLLKEDKHFHYHPGLNPVALVRAAWKTYIQRYRRIGGSTITMQLAKLRYGIRSRTVFGKVQQIIKAFQLEWHFTKLDILEAYFNLTPYGGNIEGVGAASWLFFNKPPYALTFNEALTLSVIPQHPFLLSPLTGKRWALIRARKKLYRKWVEHYPNEHHVLMVPHF